jgi:hypothetical protein
VRQGFSCSASACLLRKAKQGVAADWSFSNIVAVFLMVVCLLDFGCKVGQRPGRDEDINVLHSEKSICPIAGVEVKVHGLMHSLYC